MKKWIVVVPALAAAVLLPSPTKAADVGAGPAQGGLRCSPGGAASFDIASAAFVFEGQARSLTLSMEGDCRALGSSTFFGQGTGQLSGDGLSCGADPDEPLGAGLILQGAQAIVVTDGVCVVDGADRRLQLLGNGVVVDGQFTGVLTPDYFTALGDGRGLGGRYPAAAGTTAKPTIGSLISESSRSPRKMASPKL